MKLARSILLAVAAVLVFIAALGVRRVPDGFEAVRESPGGAFEVLSPGWYFVGPSKHLVRYPIGASSYRVPAGADSASFAVVFQDGMSLAVAFRVGIDVPPGSARTLYERFSADFAAAMERLVVAAGQIEAASITSSTGAPAFAAAVETRIRDQLAPLDITLTDVTLLRWGDHTFEAAVRGSQ